MVTISNTYSWKRRKTRIKEERHGWCWKFSDVGATKQSDRPSLFSLYPIAHYRAHEWQDRTYIEYSPLRPDDILVTSTWIETDTSEWYLDGIDTFEWFFWHFRMIFWPPALEFWRMWILPDSTATTDRVSDRYFWMVLHTPCRVRRGIAKRAATIAAIFRPIRMYTRRGMVDSTCDFTIADFSTPHSRRFRRGFIGGRGF